MSSSEQQMKKTVLYDKHLEAGAKMVPFSGWCMPVQYKGIIAEHMHTREKAGLFDICHMGEFYIKGPTATSDLDKLVTFRVDTLEVGKGRYGFMLNEAGGIIDDLIAFKTEEDEYFLVVNAGRIDVDKAWIQEHLSSETVFTDATELTAKIDLQGPASAEVLGQIIGEDVVANIKRFSFVQGEMDGTTALISRTGYTGELGFEIFCPAKSAEEIWNWFLSYEAVEPVGLGARDTLRMEKGLSLYGNDIDEEHSPLDANLSRFVYMDKDFIGKDALEEREVTQTLTGFICEGRRAARSHYKVLAGDKEVGEVTSGAFSPCLKKGIGFCYIDKNLATEGQEIILTDGKVQIEAKVKSLPIV